MDSGQVLTRSVCLRYIYMYFKDRYAAGVHNCLGRGCGLQRAEQLELAWWYTVCSMQAWRACW